MHWEKSQWIYPDYFGNVIWMLGPLHIEQNFIQTIED